MKIVWELLVMLCVGVVCILPQAFHLELHITMLLLSTVPFWAILLDYVSVRFTFREIRRQKLRMAVLLLAVLNFLVCLLSALGVIPLTRAEDMNTLRYHIGMVMAVTDLALSLVILGYRFRDVERREKGLPL